MVKFSEENLSLKSFNYDLLFELVEHSRFWCTHDVVYLSNLVYLVGTREQWV